MSTSTVNCEKRSLKAFPKLAWNDSIIQELGGYYEEHFGLRNEFTYWQSLLKLTIFNSSTNPKDVQLGKNNWFYPTSRIDYSYGSYSHRDLLTSQELTVFKKIHLDRKILLNKRNCEYLLAVWPNKATIYPEYVPRHLQWMVKDTLSKVEQIIRYFHNTNTDIPIIYPKNFLLKHKNERLYLKNDTHWNQLGAYYGYVYFLTYTHQLFQETQMPLSAFYLEHLKVTKGDLLEGLGICTTSQFLEIIPNLCIKNQVKIYSTPDDPAYKHINPSAKNSKKILFFRDSYTRNLIPFFTQHFKESYYYWQDYDQKIIDSLKPDVVVVSKVERYF